MPKVYSHELFEKYRDKMHSSDAKKSSIAKEDGL